MHSSRQQRGFSLRSIFVLAAVLCSTSPAGAQTARTTSEEYAQLIKRAGEVTPLGADLFGDRTSLYTGATEFLQTDTQLPGNDALPVAITRRFVVEDRPGIYAKGLFADWELDLPHLHGTFATNYGWQVSTATPNNRCTVTGTFEAQPPPASNIYGWFDAGEYWHGNSLHVPGQGDQPLLVVSAANTARPTDGATYYWATNAQWYFSCLPTVARGTGQGFLGRAPDGTKVWFDWIVSRALPSLTKESTAPGPLGFDSTQSAGPGGGITPQVVPDPTLARERVLIFPTRIEDRFGNWVTYTYSPTYPTRLTAINASDGRAITLSYNAQGNVSSVTDGTRTFTYQYTSGSLSGVTQPDGSSWSIAFANLVQAKVGYSAGRPSCYADGTLLTGTYSGTLTHPSGATGTFTVRAIRHGRSYVPRSCITVSSSQSYFYYPKLFDTVALVSKQITGPGLTPLTWTYTYGPANGSFSDQCGSCATTRTVEVTGPDATYARHTFGNRFQVNEGLLLTVERGASSSNLLETEQLAHVTNPTAPAYPHPFGSNPEPRGDGYFSERLTPLAQRTVSRDGAQFTLTHHDFDTYGQPTSLTRSSSLGFERSESHSYSHFPSLWVLGQLATVQETGTGQVPLARTYHAASGLPASQSAFGVLQQGYGYATTGLLTSITDPLGRVTTLGNYHRGIPRTLGYPTGASESATVNGLGRVTSTTDELGYTTSYGYDAMGRLASISYPTGDPVAWNGTSQAFVRVTSSEYGLGTGHWKRTVTTGTGRQLTYYDALWRPVLTEEVDDSDSATRRYTPRRFDGHGRETFTGHALANVACWNCPTEGLSRSYDALGRPTGTQQTSELGTLTTQVEYLSGFQRRDTNARGYATTTAYQAFDTPTEEFPVTLAYPEGVQVSIARDVFGKPLSISRYGPWAGGTYGSTRSFVYDGTERLCKQLDPESGATVTDYDGAGLVAWTATGQALPALSCDRASVPAGARVTRSYDALGRPTAVSYPDGSPALTFVYEADGALASATAGSVTTSYGYNKRRLPTQETLALDGYTFTLVRAYDANGYESQLTYPNGHAVAFNPNALGQARQAGALVSGALYAPNGALAQFSYGSGVLHTLTQNARRLPERSRDALGGTALHDLTYSYDAAGNVSGIVDGVGGRTSRTLGYDGLDRLTAASAPQLWGTGSFSYDPLDGLRTAALGSRAYSYGYDAAERLSAVTDGGGMSVLALGYDARGRVVQRNGISLGFDLGERLSSLGAEGYRYDGHGRRVRTQRSDGTRRYTQYDRAGVLRYALEAGSGEVTQYVPFGGSLTALRIGASGTVRYVHSDALGSPVAVSDVSGALLGRLEYEPYGAFWSGAPGLSGQVGYTGHEQQPSGGLLYAQARYYEPMAGRFLSPDPVGIDTRTGINYDRYGYARDNPYKFTDPDGRNPLLKLGVDFGIELGIQYLTTGEVDLTAAALDTLEGAINPLRTLERARDLGRIVSTGGKAASGTQQVLRDVILRGGRGGQNVKNLVGPPNSVVRGGGERAFVTNDKGQVVLDITRDRVKPVTPGEGFGPKRPPSPDELQLLERVLGDGS